MNLRKAILAVAKSRRLMVKGDEFAAKYRKAVVGGGEAADSAKTANQCKESSQCVATHTGHPKPSQTTGDTS